MSKSIRVVDNNTKFKLRVAGLLIKDNQLLVDEANNCGFKCLPGGYVQLLESTTIALEREMFEELGFQIEVDKLYGIIENFFVNKYSENVHEICFYYLVNAKDNKILDQNKFNIKELDNGMMINHNYEWVDFNLLEGANFKPIALIDKLLRKDFNLFHLIHKDS